MTNAARLGSGDLLKKLADEQPSIVAVVDDRKGQPVVSTNYAELNAAADRIARAIRQIGVAPGERIAWCGRNSVDVLAIDYGAGKAGVTSVGLNHRLTRSETVELLNVVGVVLVFVEAELASIFNNVSEDTAVRSVVVFGGAAEPGTLSLEELLESALQESAPLGPPASPPDAIGLSSGTTGRPKVLVRGSLPPGGVQQKVQDEIWGAGPHVFITSGAISSGASGAFAFVALAKGGKVVLQRKFDPEDWLRLVDRYKVTIAYCAPLVLRQICDLPEEVRHQYDLSSLRSVYAGAAKWSHALKLAYRSVFPPNTLWEVYGSSETGIVTVMRPDEHWTKPESCGRPAPGVDVVILDETGEVVTRPHQQGVLYARSGSSFIGYENDPGSDERARWGEGYFTVWDVAYFDEDGFYYICDRAKDMVVSGGINVYPAEIEAVLDRFPNVLETAVIGIPDDLWGEAIHAIVVPRSGQSIDVAELDAHCRQYLASHKVPRSYEIVDFLPHTLSGKVRKSELRQAYWTDNARSV